jgi:hypothetical protein
MKESDSEYEIFKKDLSLIRREANDMFNEDSSESIEYYFGIAASATFDEPESLSRAMLNLLPDHIDSTSKEYQDFIRGVNDNGGMSDSLNID